MSLAIRIASASVSKRNDRGDRPEDFLVRDGHFVRLIAGDNGRRKEQRAVRVGLAAHLDFRAMRHVASASRDFTFSIASALISGPTVDFGSRPGSNDEFCGGFFQRSDEADRKFRPARGCGWRRRRSGPQLRNFEAIVPATACCEIGVVEDDQRRVAAELERQLLDGVGGLAIEDACRLRSIR